MDMVREVATIKTLREQYPPPNPITEDELLKEIADADAIVNVRSISINRKIIDPTTRRLFFVPDPVHIKVNNAPSKQAVDLTFVPHLTPMIRGIHATLYGRITGDISEVQTLFEQRYQNELFVDVLPQGAHPDTRNVRGSNLCQLAIHQPQGGDTLVVLSVIDNLVKGAAGQAVHNMNLMCGFDEEQGLATVALYP